MQNVQNVQKTLTRFNKKDILLRKHKFIVFVQSLVQKIEMSLLQWARAKSALICGWEFSEVSNICCQYWFIPRLEFLYSVTKNVFHQGFNG